MELKVGRKPCTDCPFRLGVLPYQTRELAEKSLDNLHNQNMVEICHHTYYKNYRFNTGLERPLEQQRKCVGAILYARNLGIKKKHDPGNSIIPSSLQALVYSSISQFLKGVVAENNKQAVENWITLQPSSLQERIKLFQQEKRNNHET